MAVSTIGRDGTMILPPEILDAAEVEAGDIVCAEVAGPRTIVLTFTSDPNSIAAVVAEGARAPAQSETARLPLGNQPVDYDSLPRLTLAELLERYPITVPVDLEADREAIYDEMAKDVFGERLDRFGP